MSAATMPTTASTEDVRAVIHRANAGDKDAFAELYRRYQVTVHRFVARRVSNPTVAEDLTAEVFCRALRGIGGFTWQGHDPVKWLCTIAANLIRDHFDLSSTRREVVSDDAVAGQDRRVRSVARRDPLSGDGPEAAVLASMTADALREAIANLTEQQQRCIVLRFFGGFDTEETATQMGITARAVVSLQYRAIQALRDLLPASVRTGAEPTGRSWAVTTSVIEDRTSIAEQASATPADADDVEAAAPASELERQAEVQDVADPAPQAEAAPAGTVTAGRRPARIGSVLIRIPAAETSMLTCLRSRPCPSCSRGAGGVAPGRVPALDPARRNRPRALRRSRAKTSSGRPAAVGCVPRRGPGARSGSPTGHVPSAFGPSSPSPPGLARPRSDQHAATGTGLFMDLWAWKAVTL